MLEKTIHLKEILSLFNKEQNATKVARIVCENNNIEYNESEGRKVRSWLSKTKKEDTFDRKVLVYDLETSLIRADVWWTGEQVITHNQIQDESKIITVSYKWLDEDEVHCLVWNQDKQCDKVLVQEFLKAYNEADFVIGVNNDNFDNRFIAARAMKYDFYINTFVRSLDIQKECKRLFKLPSYSMSYLGRYLELDTRKSDIGINVWKTIKYNKNKKKSKEALTTMSDYNILDVMVTEQIYLKLRKYFNSPIHIGVLNGNTKYSCPTCGNNNLTLSKTTCTPQGTIQRIMKCNNDKTTFKISNTVFKKYN